MYNILCHKEMDIKVITVVQERVNVTTTTGEVVRTRYFGGPKKGGAAPSATGFMIAKSSTQAFQPAAPALKPNFLFNFRQNYTIGNPRSGGPLL
jgi:hypothetical protein